MVGDSRPSGSSIIRSLELVTSCLGLFAPYSAHVPSFHISRYSLTIILASAPTFSFTLAVPIREVYCAKYTPRAWDLRSLQFIINVPFVFPARCYGSVERQDNYYYYYYLLLFLCLLLPLASPLLFPYARYPVQDTHLMHGMDPRSQSFMLNSLVSRSVNNSYWPKTALRPHRLNNIFGDLVIPLHSFCFYGPSLLGYC